MRIQRLIILVLLLATALSPLASGAGLDVCAGTPGCPHCRQPEHMPAIPVEEGPHADACCEASPPAACDIANRRIPGASAYLNQTRIHIDPDLQPAAFSAHPAVIAAGQVFKADRLARRRSAPLAVPIYLQNSTLLC